MTGPVNNDLQAYKTSNDEKIAGVVAKHDSDISQVNERIATTDNRLNQTNAKLDQTTQTAVQAQGTASRAMDAVEANSAKDAAAIARLSATIANGTKYDLVTKTDVNFAFNKWTLTKEAEAALDEIASKAQPFSRFQVELAGFTDPVGSRAYNIELSQKRADAVQRYLVRHNIPLRTIYTVGLGENAPPPAFPLATAESGSLSKSELHRLSRRVSVQLYGAAAPDPSTGAQNQ